jgi:hypothetical protein
MMISFQPRIEFSVQRAPRAHVGDTITFAQEIVELRAVANRPEVGLRIARNTGTNQRGELVYSVLSSTFIERHPPNSKRMDG